MAAPADPCTRRPTLHGSGAVSVEHMQLWQGALLTVLNSPYEEHSREPTARISTADAQQLETRRTGAHKLVASVQHDDVIGSVGLNGGDDRRHPVEQQAPRAELPSAGDRQLHHSMTQHHFQPEQAVGRSPI